MGEGINYKDDINLAFLSETPKNQSSAPSPNTYWICL
jgi:hypothetical protein